MEQYDYITTKPELNEKTLAHYGIKGMKWKKRLNSYYSKKSKAQEMGTKVIRNILYGYGAKDPSRISYKSGTEATPRNDDGKANSFSKQPGLRNVKTTRIKLPKNKNLRDRGYSHSQGSGESKRLRNIATRKSIYKKITPNAPTGKDTMTLQDYRAIMQRLNSKKHSGKTTYKKKESVPRARKKNILSGTGSVNKRNK